ncbi:hypothetical protein GCM10027185_13030 [Spirosoma pulveris]
MGFFVAYAVAGTIGFYLLKYYYVQTKAIIIDKENYFGNNSGRFAYSYEFQVNGKFYSRSSQHPKYKVGERVTVEYLPFYPRISKVIE